MKQKMVRTKEGMAVMVPADEDVASAQKAADPKFNRHADGSITMTPVIDELQPTSPTTQAKPVEAGLGKKAVVSVPQESEPHVMPASAEVSWTDLRPALSKITDELQGVIHGLIGMSRVVAEGVLSGLKSNQQIDEFRVLKSGQMFSMEVMPGRVQLLVDKSDVVISTQIG